ncbi:MAG: ABC transporter permease [Nitrospinae bacterium]|nr:ABC transporter permease [Nitrospinota bacterium]MBI3812878.1 ABC transporter permease [Nitrospinota bacterium]
MNLLHPFIYAFQEAMTSIRMNKGLNAITIGTIAVSMTLFGIFLLTYINLQKAATGLGGKIKMVAYLKDTVTHQQAESLKKTIASYNEIERFSYIAKEEALSDFKKKLRDKKTILDGLGSNPLPASFIIEVKESFKTLSSMEDIARRLENIEGVEEVEYGREWIDRFETLMVFFKLGMTAVGGVLMVGLLFIISNTIKLSVYSRLDEIEIMKLVGATNRFIKGPFIIEGMIQGLLGSFISILLLTVIYEIFMSKINPSLMIIFGLSDLSFIQPKLIAGMVISGISLGFIGSVVSLGRILKVRT